MFPIIIENTSAHATRQWVFTGLPQKVIDDLPAFGYLTDGTYHYPYVREAKGLRVEVAMQPNSMLKLEKSSKELHKFQFDLHPAIADDVGAMLPTFRLGTEDCVPLQFVSMEAAGASQIWQFRSGSLGSRLYIDFWATVSSGSPTVEYIVQATYGDTRNDGQSQTTALPRLVMHVGTKPVADFCYAPAAVWDAASKRWVQEIAPAKLWHRASTHELRGALLPMPDPARAQGRVMYGLYTGWNGSWLALGKTPTKTIDVGALRAVQRRDYVSRLTGNYHDPRPRTQQYNAGQTGEQVDFGAASDLAVTAEMPWEIHDALWQCQSYVQRPVHNKEPDGRPMAADRHPNAETMGQRPDLNLGEADRLGWPGINQIQWIPSPSTTLWTTADDQHRADNFLHATYLLTADPALRQCIQDHIELDKTDVYIRRRMAVSPRAVGRMALTRANQVFLGFADAADNLRIGLDSALATSPYNTLPPDRGVRTIGGREQAKYGWLDQNGAPVIGWQPWQETIAAIGFLAAGRVLSSADYTKVASDLMRTIDYNAWDVRHSKPRHAYAIRWNEGRSFGMSSFPMYLNSGGEGNTGDIYVSGACDYWTLVASYAIDPLGIVAAAYGPPTTIAQARWSAV